MRKSHKTASILGIDCTSSDLGQLLKWVSDSISSRQKFFIVTPNPEIITRAQSDKDLMRILNHAEISLPDGAGVVFAARFLNGSTIKRIPGRIFMEKLFDLANNKRLKIFLLGSTDIVIERSLARLKQEFPHVLATGKSGPVLNEEGVPVNEKEEKKNRMVISEVNAFKPDFLFIAFGSPKQEKWYDHNKQQLQTRGAMVVGGSLDYYSRTKKVPPALFQQLGIEWVWRLMHERAHLPRVITAVIVFPLLVMKEAFLKNR